MSETGITVPEAEAKWVAKPYEHTENVGEPLLVVGTSDNKEILPQPYQSEIVVWQAEPISLSKADRTLTHKDRYVLKEQGRERVNVAPVTSRKAINPWKRG